MVSQVFSFIHKKQTSKNVADTSFKLKKSPFLHHTWYKVETDTIFKTYTIVKP